jgi:hypothetical protein
MTRKKPGRACSVCTHPDHLAIDAALQRGEQQQRIAERHSIPKGTLSRHASHVDGGRQGARPVEILTPQEEDALTRRLTLLEKLTDTVLADARQANEPDLLLRGVKRALELLQARAELQRELETRSVAKDFDLRVSAAWDELTAAAIEATADCSSCRQRLAAVLLKRKTREGVSRPVRDVRRSFARVSKSPSEDAS